jgi:hypothetical protein
LMRCARSSQTPASCPRPSATQRWRPWAHATASRASDRACACAWRSTLSGERRDAAAARVTPPPPIVLRQTWG